MLTQTIKIAQIVRFQDIRHLFEYLVDVVGANVHSKNPKTDMFVFFPKKGKNSSFVFVQSNFEETNRFSKVYDQLELLTNFVTLSIIKGI